MSEPVQVYTACQFVKGQNTALIYFQLGNNSTMPPVANSSTSRNTLFQYLNLCPTWVQVKLRVLTIGLVPKSGTSQRAGTVPLANLARSNLVPIWYKVRKDSYKMTSVQFVQKLSFIPDELAVISLSDNSSGSFEQIRKLKSRCRFSKCKLFLPMCNNKKEHSLQPLLRLTMSVPICGVRDCYS